MKTTLVLMAAGLGSRFKGGIKALTQVGPNGEIIMDYSVHDAIMAGFDRIVFVINKHIENDFKSLIFERINAVCVPLGVECTYVIQNLKDTPVPVNVERTKPWGTCQAVLAARDCIDGPFCVLNADDFYGKMAFRKVHWFLEHMTNDNELCMAGFQIMKTLSENGGVTRGICALDYDGYLCGLVETKNIVKGDDGAVANGAYIAPNTCVSMNMWGMPRTMLDSLADGFKKFLGSMNDPMTDEFLLPVYIGELLNKGKVKVKVLPTSGRWFGVTYIEDKDKVIDEIRTLVERGDYPDRLYSDLHK